MALSEAKVREIYNSEYDTFSLATDRLKQLLEQLIGQLSAEFGVREGTWVSGEAKEFDSFYDKVVERGVEDADECLDAVRDFARARVVVQTVDDVYRLRDLLQEQAILVPDWTTAQDYIEKPNSRGYRSYHIDVGVEVPDGRTTRTVPCELQIRSAIQQAWSGFSHKDFYKGADVPPVYHGQIAELANLLASVDKMAADLIRNLNAALADGSADATTALTERSALGRARRLGRGLRDRFTPG